MGLYTYNSTDIPKTDRIPKLVEHLYAKLPEIESARAVLITESYRQTENEPMIIRRAKAFQHILENIPIIIRDLEHSAQGLPDLPGVFLRVAGSGV